MKAVYIRRYQSGGGDKFDCVIDPESRLVTIINLTPYYGGGLDPDPISEEAIEIEGMEFGITWNGDDRFVNGLAQSATPFANALHDLVEAVVTSNDAGVMRSHGFTKAKAMLDLVNKFDSEFGRGPVDSLPPRR